MIEEKMKKEKGKLFQNTKGTKVKYLSWHLKFLMRSLYVLLLHSFEATGKVVRQ